MHTASIEQQIKYIITLVPLPKEGTSSSIEYYIFQLQNKKKLELNQADKNHLVNINGYWRASATELILEWK